MAQVMPWLDGTRTSAAAVQRFLKFVTSRRHSNVRNWVESRQCSSAPREFDHPQNQKQNNRRSGGKEQRFEAPHPAAEKEHETILDD